MKAWRLFYACSFVSDADAETHGAMVFRLLAVGRLFEEMEVMSFSTRAYPLLDMLREARKGGCDVVWGV